MKRTILFAFVMSAAAMTQLHAGGRRGEERAFAPPQPMVRQMPPPGVGPKLQIEPQRQLQTSPQNQSTPQQQPKQRIAQQQTTQRSLSFDEARARMTRERHDRAWWNERYDRIVRAGTGFYVFDEGYWFPALGYDPNADIYAYEGPIHALADMTPDQEITAVQEQLEADGYYSGSITGVLDSVTQQALAKFQADKGLLATGAIDQPTIEALGLA